MLDRGLKRLSRYGAAYCGLDLASLREEVTGVRARIGAGEAFPEDHRGLPRYRLEGRG
jgi:hypothetical protein